jgi:hypothetical protein
VVLYCGEQAGEEVAMGRVLSVLVLAALAAAAIWSSPAAAASGDVVWTRLVDGGAHGRDAWNSVVPGPAGSVYVAGTLATSSGSRATLVRYSAGGSRRWSRDIAADGIRADFVAGMTTDSAGNVYVAGPSWTIWPTPWDDGQSTTVVAKYTPTGGLVWSASWAGGFGGVNSPVALALHSGDLYVAATSTGMGSGTNIVVLKYDDGGDLQWGGEGRYVGPRGGSRAADLAVDAAGNVYVAGSGPGAGGDSDAVVVRWDPAGNLIGDSVDSAFGVDNYASTIELTRTGVVVMGWLARTGDDLDWVVAKYATTGELVWHKQWGGSAHGADSPEAMAIDAKGDVYVTGYSYGAKYASCVTRKYAGAGGGLVWSRTIAKAPGIRGECIAVVGPSVYIGGFTGGAVWRAFVTKYSASGGLAWTRLWEAVAGRNAAASGLAVAAGEALWLVGEAGRAGTGADAFLQKRQP